MSYLKMFKFFKEGRDKFLHHTFSDPIIAEIVSKELEVKTCFSTFLYTVPFYLKQQNAKINR